MGTICIIDDDEIYKLIFRKKLQMSGLELNLLEFKNGEDAMNYFTFVATQTAKFPQIVFLDINMPVSDGWDFLQKFAALKSIYLHSTAIYIVSAAQNVNDYMRAKSITEISGYFVKPISDAHMKEIIDVAYKLT